MSVSSFSHRSRVNRAIEHNTTDRVPRDFACEPGVWNNLFSYFGTKNKEEILRRFDIDCRVVSYDFEIFCRPPEQDFKHTFSPWKKKGASGKTLDIWGARRKYVSNVCSGYEELCEFPLADAASVNDLRCYKWPTPEWWDFGALAEVINKINPQDEYHLRYRIGSIFETAWSLCGLDKMLEHLVLNPELPCYMMDRIAEVHTENLKRVLELAGDTIDMVYLYDDLAGQLGLLISPQMWRSTIAKRQEQLFDIARGHHKKVMYHCCGNICPLIDDLIDIGVDVLNPIQPLAMEMDFEMLKEQYGDRVTFHGGIDIQELLPHGSPEEVKNEVERTVKTLGRDGGYILAPAHHIQSDTPIENIVALYGLK